MWENKIVRIAVFASTNASDFPAIFQSIKSWILKWKCEIRVAIVNNHNSWSISKFRDNNIACEIVETKGQKRGDVYMEINKILEYNNIDLIICIWWMNIINKIFVEKWSKRILNVHPSLLPDYPWMHAIEDVLNAWEKITWCSVHYIDEGVDTWEIIIKKEVEILKGDTFDSLKNRIQVAEQEIYPKAILKVLSSMVI